MVAGVPTNAVAAELLSRRRAQSEKAGSLASPHCLRTLAPPAVAAALPVRRSLIAYIAA